MAFVLYLHCVAVNHKKESAVIVPVPAIENLLETNFRSSQPNATQLEVYFHTGVKTVIRLNGNEGGLTIEEERAICEQNGVDFHYFNIEGKHSLNKQNLDKIQMLLDGGYCLVHCKHGYDRTGAAIAWWLRNKGVPAETIQEHNQWPENYPDRGKGYARYYQCSL